MAIIILIVVALDIGAVPIANTSPYAELGIKFTKFNTTFVVYYEGYKLWVLENYLGVNAECLLCFFNNLFFRLEFIEFRKYEYTGEMQIIALSNLNMDIEYQIPIGCLVKPLVYCGIRYGPFVCRPNLDTLLDIYNREFHFGCGLLLPLKTKFKIIFESYLYTDNIWWWHGEGGNSDQIQTWGFEKLSLGLRYKFITF